MHRDEQAPLADPPYQVRITLLEGLDMDAVKCSGLANWNFLRQLKGRQTVDADW